MVTGEIVGRRPGKEGGEPATLSVAKCNLP